MKPLRNPAGFTLLELMLSLFIIAIIAAMALGGIRLGITTRDSGEIKVETYQRLRIIGEQLTQKIKSVYPKFIAPQETLSDAPGDRKTQSSGTLAFEGKPDSIRFLTFADPLTPTGKSGLAYEVQFYLGKHPETREQGIIMMERELSEDETFKPPTFRTENARFFLLAKNVAYLKFRYYQVEKELDLGALDDELLDQEGKITNPYTGEWVDSILFIPPIQSEVGNRPAGPFDDTKDASTFSETITLPKGIEVSFGLYEPSWQGEGEPHLIYSPPIVVPLYSGTKFALIPVVEENDET